MGLQFRKRVPLGRHVWINLSTGVPSISVRVGRLTFNSKRGFSTARIGKGFSWVDRD